MSFLVLAALLALSPASAAPRPLAWRADFPSARVENFPVRHGTDVEFRPSWYVNGSPADTNGWTYSLSVQTNGAPAGEWATIPGTVFSHTNDCGAEAYNVLVRAVDRDGTVDYSAAARLRMLPSPGFTPGELPPADTFQESDPVFSAWLASFQESDPVFSSWLSTFEIPETSLEPATNYTAQSLASFAATGTVLRASSYGTPTRWADATGCVWEATLRDWVANNIGLPDGEHVEWQGPSWNTTTDDYYYDRVGWFVSTSSMTPEYLGNDENAVTLELDWGRYDEIHGYYNVHTVFTRSLATNLVGRVALTNDIPAEIEEVDPTVPSWAKEAEKPSYTPAEIGAAPAAITNEMAEMRTENQLVYRLYQGSNVVAEVTNYNSNVHAPELRIMQLNESNEYVTVWAETNGLARTLAGARQYTDDATGAVVQAVAPRAWSKVTAGMGVDAPSNTTWLSTGRTVIAGGLEYEKHVTSGGAIWLLESNGMAADFNPQTNNVAFLDLSNADGTPIFRVEKTDSFLVGVHIDGVTVDGNALVCRVGVVASEHPYVRISTDLKTWSKEEDGIPSSLATVTWSGSAGYWTCRIANNTGGTPFFANMEYMQEGGTKIVNSAPLDVSSGIICKDGIHKVRPVYSNGAITWELVQ